MPKVALDEVAAPVVAVARNSCTTFAQPHLEFGFPRKTCTLTAAAAVAVVLCIDLAE